MTDEEKLKISDLLGLLANINNRASFLGNYLEPPDLKRMEFATCQDCFKGMDILRDLITQEQPKPKPVMSVKEFIHNPIMGG